jgi:hypothetical protein
MHSFGNRLNICEALPSKSKARCEHSVASSPSVCQWVSATEVSAAIRRMTGLVRKLPRDGALVPLIPNKTATRCKAAMLDRDGRERYLRLSMAVRQSRSCPRALTIWPKVARETSGAPPDLPFAQPRKKGTQQVLSGSG